MRVDNMIRLMIAPALLVMLLAGCVKRDLEVRFSGMDGYAQIALDWGGQTHPQTARFLFYNELGKLVTQATGVTEAKGFKGALAAGRYRVVVCNEDAVNVDYRGMDSYATAEVFALAKDARSGRQSSRASTLIQEPKQVFGTGVCKEFEQIVIEPNKTTTATVEPKLLTREIQFLFEVKGVVDVRSLEGIIDGVSSAVSISTGMSNSEAIGRMEFSASPRSAVDAQQSIATGGEFVVNLGVFNLLTTATSVAGTNTTDIILTETNNTEHSVTFDLTEVLKEIIRNNGGVIPIEIPIEVILEVKPIEGLTATIRSWDNTGSGSGNPRP